MNMIKSAVGIPPHIHFFGFSCLIKVFIIIVLFNVLCYFTFIQDVSAVKSANNGVLYLYLDALAVSADPLVFQWSAVAPE